MFESYEEKALKLSIEIRKISPCLLMRKLSITFEMAEKLCFKIWKDQHNMARKLAKEYEYE